MFIQVQKHWRHFYTGVCEGNGLRANFDTVHLKKTPPQFDHLSGMIDLFRSKLVGGMCSLIVLFSVFLFFLRGNFLV